jgi:hypothetical protein
MPIETVTRHMQCHGRRKLQLGWAVFVFGFGRRLTRMKESVGWLSLIEVTPGFDVFHCVPIVSYVPFTSIFASAIGGAFLAASDI